MPPLYPQDSEQAGPAFWVTMHNVAAKYPQRPDSHDKLMFKHWLDYTIDHYVCRDPCVKNAKKYLKANPLDLSSRKALSYDLCKFHNHTRQDQGKRTIECDSILGETKSPDLFDGPTTVTLLLLIMTPVMSKAQPAPMAAANKR